MGRERLITTIKPSNKALSQFNVNNNSQQYQFCNLAFGISVSWLIFVTGKDWEQPNLRIWSAEVDIDRGLNVPI